MSRVTLATLSHLTASQGEGEPQEQWRVVDYSLLTTHLYFLIGNLAYKVTPPCMFMIRNHRYHFLLLDFEDLSVNLMTQEIHCLQRILALLGKN